MAELVMLGIIVPMEPNRQYHDDGFVDSMYRHYFGLLKLYHYQIGSFANGEPMGYMFIAEKKRIKHYHIFYKNINPSVNIFVRGHEETHVLDEFNWLDLLSVRLLKEMNVRVNFREIKNPQLIANIGGIYAFFRQGFPAEMLDRISSISTYHAISLREAKKILAIS